MRSRQTWLILAAVLLAGFALWTRLQAPWRVDVINDEMHHLQSWRNRYGTSNVYPLFLSRIRRTGQLKGRMLELVERVYHSGPVAQRGLLVLIDPQPPLFPVMAECIEAVSRSSLLALRIPSALVSLASVLLIYLIGRKLKDEALGIWLGTLMTIGVLAQVYAGIGRPYALTLFTLVLAVYAYVLQVSKDHASPWRFWLAALLAQSTQWMNWAPVGLLVICELVRLYRRDRSMAQLIRQSWWYGVVSMLLLAEMAIQLKNPTISAQGGAAGLGNIWTDFSIASPFAEIGSFGHAELMIGGAVMAALILTGAYVFPGESLAVKRALAIKAGLLLALAGSVLAALLIGSSVRFMVSYTVVPTIMAGIACRWLSRRPVPSLAAATAVLLAFIGIHAVHPQNPYQYVLVGDTPYHEVAAQLHAVMKPEDVWAGWPYFRANCLYQYGPFPEPALPDDREQLEKFLDRRPAGARAFVFTQGEQLDLPEFATASRHWTYENDLTLVEFPPTPATTHPAQAR